MVVDFKLCSRHTDYTIPWLYPKVEAALSTDTSWESSNLSGDKSHLGHETSAEALHTRSSCSTRAMCSFPWLSGGISAPFTCKHVLWISRKAHSNRPAEFQTCFDLCSFQCYSYPAHRPPVLLVCTVIFGFTGQHKVQTSSRESGEQVYFYAML